VKRETIKAEVKAEYKADAVPRPPKHDPQMKRTVTIGDDSEEEDVVQDEASIMAAVRKGRDECISELAKTVFRKERASHQGARPRLAMVRYATKRASRPRFPRQIFILRGAPGVGKTDYAIRQLAEFTDVEADDELAVRLTHVCSVADYFEEFKGDDAAYRFELHRLEAAHKHNELRARFAMEAGIHPLFVDCTNLRLWEMRPYVQLAERLGYVSSVIEPHEICERWDDIEYLAAANGTIARQASGRTVQIELLGAMLREFEPLPKSSDALEAIRQAQRPAGKRVVDPQDESLKHTFRRAGGNVASKRPAGGKGQARNGYA